MACAFPDKDQAFLVQDFGPGGVVASMQFNLSQGVKPGTVISAVVTADQDVEFNVRDAKKNILIHVVVRVSNSHFGVNSLKDGVWGKEISISPFPVQRSHRFVLTLVYGAGGYQVFINGAQVAYLPHRFNTPAHLFEINAGQIFKVIYLTVRDIVPM